MDRRALPFADGVPKLAHAWENQGTLARLPRGGGRDKRDHREHAADLHGKKTRSEWLYCDDDSPPKAARATRPLSISMR